MVSDRRIPLGQLDTRRSDDFDTPSPSSTRIGNDVSGMEDRTGKAAGDEGVELGPIHSSVKRMEERLMDEEVEVESHNRLEEPVSIDHEYIAHPSDLHLPHSSHSHHSGHSTHSHNDEVRSHPSSTRPPTPPAPTRVLSTDPSKPYSAFSQSTKYLIVGISGLAGVFSPISSNIFVPAIPTLADEFNRSEQDISLAVTIYLIFQAITPSIFGAMSDSFGRRPVYIGTLLVYLGANVGLAVMPTSEYWLLLFLRALQSTGGSAVISIGSGCVADIAEPRERGKYVSFFLLGSMLGPALGPLLGGILAQTLGWRSIFWFLVISTGVILVPLIFFMPETLRSLVGDGSIPPPPLSMSPGMYLHQRKADKETKARGEEVEVVERPPAKKYRPWSAFLILLVPEISLGFIAISFLYLEFYCILTLYSTALRDKYGLSDLKIGLAYLSNGFGIMVSVLTNGRYIDWRFRREEKRVGGDYRKVGEDFKIERTRYGSIIPFTSVFLVACIAQGWCLEVKAPLGATIAMGFFVGLGSGVINVGQLYGQDILPGQGGAVSASLNLVRCLFAAVGTAVIQLLYKSIGAGWTMVLLSGLSIAAMPLFWVIARYGPKWRADRRDRKERKQAKKAQGGSKGNLAKDTKPSTG